MCIVERNYVRRVGGPPSLITPSPPQDVITYLGWTKFSASVVWLTGVVVVTGVVVWLLAW